MNARVRVDLKKDGSVIGDTSTPYIGIEDGAQFKGRIEIALTQSQTAADWLSISSQTKEKAITAFAWGARCESPHLSG